MRLITKRNGNHFTLLLYREKYTETHHEVVENFLTHATRMGMNPVLRKEIDLDDGDLTQDTDLVVSIGGNSTYL